MCDSIVADWFWVILQLVFGGGLGGIIFQVMQVKGPNDKHLIHPFLIIRAAIGGIGCAFVYLFLAIHLGHFTEITLEDIQIIRTIIYSMVSGFVGLIFLCRMDLWKR